MNGHGIRASAFEQYIFTVKQVVDGKDYAIGARAWTEVIPKTASQNALATRYLFKLTLTRVTPKWKLATRKR